LIVEGNVKKLKKVEIKDIIAPKHKYLTFKDGGVEKCEWTELKIETKRI